MTRAILVVAVVGALLLFVGGGGAQTSSTVAVDSTVLSINRGADSRSETLYLWERGLRRRPIGHAVLTCINVGSSGALGGGIHNCYGTYVLPLGKMTVSGLIHSWSRFTLVVTGGSGRYVGADGHLFSRRVGPATRAALFKVRF